MARKEKSKYQKCYEMYSGNMQAYAKIMHDQTTWIVEHLMAHKDFTQAEAEEVRDAVIAPHFYPPDGTAPGTEGYYETGPCHYLNPWLRTATPAEIRSRFVRPRIIPVKERTRPEPDKFIILDGKKWKMNRKP